MCCGSNDGKGQYAARIESFYRDNFKSWPKINVTGDVADAEDVEDGGVGSQQRSKVADFKGSISDINPLLKANLKSNSQSVSICVSELEKRDISKKRLGIESISILTINNYQCSLAV